MEGAQSDEAEVRKRKGDRRPPRHPPEGGRTTAGAMAPAKGPESPKAARLRAKEERGWTQGAEPRQLGIIASGGTRWR